MCLILTCRCRAGKWICDRDVLLAHEDCAVFSLGSWGDTSFEQVGCCPNWAAPVFGTGGLQQDAARQTHLAVCGQQRRCRSMDLQLAGWLAGTGMNVAARHDPKCCWSCSSFKALRAPPLRALRGRLQVQRPVGAERRSKTWQSTCCTVLCARAISNKSDFPSLPHAVLAQLHGALSFWTPS